MPPDASAKRGARRARGQRAVRGRRPRADRSALRPRRRGRSRIDQRVPGTALPLAPRLVPSPLRGKNLAQLLPRKSWEQIREEALTASGRRCEVCGATDRLHGDELWEYDDRRKVATLRRVRIICKMCHAVVHWGRTGEAQQGAELERVRAHALAVNHCSLRVWERRADEAYKIWMRRNGRGWAIDWGDYARLAPGNLPEQVDRHGRPSPARSTRGEGDQRREQ